MAKCTNKLAISLNLVAVFSVFLLMSVAIAKSTSRLGFGALVAEKEAVLTCNSVYGVQSGDTCAGVIQMFSLDAVFFSVINPNLNCDKIFAGQWLCVDGKVN